MNREQVHLEKIINVMRQKKLTLIIIAPSYFDLSKGIAVRRSRFLLHTYADNKLRRGKFLYWGENKKRILYEEGKKNYGSYAKPIADWDGDFLNFKLPFEEEYLRTKRETINVTINKDNTPSGETSGFKLDKSTEWALKKEFAKFAIIANMKEKKPLSLNALSRYLGMTNDTLASIARENGLLATKFNPLHYYSGESEDKPLEDVPEVKEMVAE